MGLLDTSIDNRLGARIRELRTARGLTLDDLASRSETSRGMLSRVERGESSPTAQLLVRVCGGLGTTLSTLFADAEAPVSPVARRRAQMVWRDPESGYVRRAVSPPSSDAPVEIVEVEFQAGGRVAFDNRRIVGTDQHVWVLDGTLELELGGEVTRLETGDCMVMRLGQPIVFHNPTEQPVRYAVITCRARA